jgi:hypothetical protein
MATNISEKPAASFNTEVEYGGSRFLQNAAAHNLEDHKLSNYQDNLYLLHPFL